MARSRIRRRVTDWAARSLMAVCVVIAAIPLLSIIFTTVQQGGSVILRPGFLTSAEPLPCTPGIQAGCSYGGIAPAIEGTFYMMLLASAIAIPVGILAGIFLSEYGRNKVGRSLSFLVDVLSGVPSIVVGVFVYSLVLLYDPHHVFSATSGGLALSILMIPLVVRTTEESLRLVPNTTREGALALGIPRYRSTVQIVLPSGGAAVLTGAILAVARAGGDAAVLLLTAFGNRLGFTGWNQPAEAIPPLIYNFGTSAAGNWQADAWGSALLLILVMLSLSLSARVIMNRRIAQMGGA